MPTPEESARQRIDAALRAAGWAVQDRAAVNLWAAPGVAVREFPLKPGYGEAEQHRIVADVERRLSVVDELEATVAANLERAERLQQAILRRAFAGQLVPQDPNEEPAGVLLERIRAERLTAPSANQGRRGRKRSQAAATVPLPGLAAAG